MAASPVAVLSAAMPRGGHLATQRPVKKRQR
jgi:hypothetical protein